jgi:hypothetical protein
MARRQPTTPASMTTSHRAWVPVATRRLPQIGRDHLRRVADLVDLFFEISHLGFAHGFQHEAPEKASKPRSNLGELQGGNDVISTPPPPGQGFNIRHFQTTPPKKLLLEAPKKNKKNGI